MTNRARCPTCGQPYRQPAVFLRCQSTSRKYLADLRFVIPVVDRAMRRNWPRRQDPNLRGLIRRDLQLLRDYKNLTKGD